MKHGEGTGEGAPGTGEGAPGSAVASIPKLTSLGHGCDYTIDQLVHNTLNKSININCLAGFYL